MKVRKAVIPAAGWGTRFLPATKAQPKETLPLVDKPMIQYAVEEAVAAGISQIILVTALGKRALEDYLDRSMELELFLEQKGETRLLKEVQRISNLADVCYVRQKEQLGLGHAVLITKDVVGNEPFAVILPDVILPDDTVDNAHSALRQMLALYERYQASVIAVEQVERQRTRSYGIIEPRKVGEEVYQVLGMVEKPSPEEAPSNLAILGRYLITPEIFNSLREAKPGKLGEIQLTDGLQLLLKRQAMYAYEFTGERHDAGNPLGLLKASVTMALRRPDVGPGLREFLRGLKL